MAVGDKKPVLMAEAVGQPGGVAPLDENAQIPVVVMPTAITAAEVNALWAATPAASPASN